jgi:hypothetical protein
MCGNLYISELYRFISDQNTQFQNDKLCVIELLFTGFIPFFTNEMQHKASVERTRELTEQLLNQNSQGNISGR